jgi:hypothetical protein
MGYRKFFTEIDCEEAFLQLKLRPMDQDVLAFTWEGQQYAFVDAPLNDVEHYVSDITNVHGQPLLSHNLFTHFASDLCFSIFLCIGSLPTAVQRPLSTIYVALIMGEGSIG